VNGPREVTAADLERALLGALIQTPSLILYADKVSPSHFVSSDRAAVLVLLREMSANRDPITALFVAHSMVKRFPSPSGLTWHAAIGRLLDAGTELCGDPELVEACARRIKECSVSREIAKIRSSHDLTPPEVTL